MVYAAFICILQEQTADQELWQAGRQWCAQPRFSYICFKEHKKLIPRKSESLDSAAVPAKNHTSPRQYDLRSLTRIFTPPPSIDTPTVTLQFPSPQSKTTQYTDHFPPRHRARQTLYKKITPPPLCPPNNTAKKQIYTLGQPFQDN